MLLSRHNIYKLKLRRMKIKQILKRDLHQVERKLKVSSNNFVTKKKNDYNERVIRGSFI